MQNLLEAEWEIYKVYFWYYIFIEPFENNKIKKEVKAVI